MQRFAVGTRAFAETAEQLDLYGDGEVLILGHGLWRLTVHHDSAVARSPVGTARGLFPDEAVLGGDEVMRELLTVEDMTETILE